MKTSAPNKVGPTYDDTVPVRTGTPATNAVAVSPGTVRVTFGAAWDFDNTRLTYQVYRDRGTAAEKLIKTYTFDSNFWTVPDQIVTDTGAPTGDHTYQIRITDPFGNELLSPVSNTVTVGSATLSAYAAQVGSNGADHYWRLGEPSGSVAYDSVGTADGVVQAGSPEAPPEPSPATPTPRARSTAPAPATSVPARRPWPARPPSPPRAGSTPRPPRAASSSGSAPRRPGAAAATTGRST